MTRASGCRRRTNWPRLHLLPRLRPQLHCKMYLFKTPVTTDRRYVSPRLLQTITTGAWNRTQRRVRIAARDTADSGRRNHCRPPCRNLRSWALRCQLVRGALLGSGRLFLAQSLRRENDRHPYRHHKEPIPHTCPRRIHLTDPHLKCKLMIYIASRTMLGVRGKISTSVRLIPPTRLQSLDGY